jgi:hypothetical protein
VLLYLVVALPNNGRIGGRGEGRASAGSPSLKVVSLPVLPLAAAGLIWALYNAALAMVFSFGPALLIERGLGPAASGSMTSLFMFVFAVAVPFGGVLADRTGRRDLVIAMSLLSFVLLIPLALIVPPAAVMAVFVAVGIGFAFAAGPIMTLPASVLPPDVRTFGMGVFFTLYYAVMMIAPPVGGVLAEAKKAKLQAELLKVQKWVKETGQKFVLLFEGRDAAGKGGTIKRFMEHLNPREARVVALGTSPPKRNAGNGSSSVTSSICRRRARSCSTTGRGTTAPAWSG